MPAGLGLFEHGALRLPDVRVGVVGPLDVVEGAVLPRDVGDEAEDAVAAGREAGPEGGEADGGGAGAGRGEVADRPGEARERGREVGMGAQEVGPEPVDEQDHDSAGAAEGGGEVERIGREVPALARGRREPWPRRAARRRAWRSRRAAPPGPARGVSRAGGEDVQAGGDVAVGRLLGEGQFEGTDGPRLGAGGGLEQVGDDGDPAPRPGRRPAPSTSASRSCGVKRRRAGFARAGAGSRSSSSARASTGCPATARPRTAPARLAVATLT